MKFQSQPRCRFLSHIFLIRLLKKVLRVSISTEMPLPEPPHSCCMMVISYVIVSISTEMPLPEPRRVPRGASEGVPQVHLRGTYEFLKKTSEIMFLIESIHAEPFFCKYLCGDFSHFSHIARQRAWHDHHSLPRNIYLPIEDRYVPPGAFLHDPGCPLWRYMFHIVRKYARCPRVDESL